MLHGLPWVRDTLQRADMFIGVSVLSALGALSALITLLATSWQVAVLVGVATAAFFLLLVLVVGGYRTWEETDQTMAWAFWHCSGVSTLPGLSPYFSTTAVWMSIRHAPVLHGRDDEAIGV